MASQWYYTKDGKQKGPVSSHDLKQMARAGLLKRTDWIWKEGTATRGQAGTARNLFPEESGTVQQAEKAKEEAVQPETVSEAHKPAPDSAAEYQLVDVVDDSPSESAPSSISIKDEGARPSRARRTPDRERARDYDDPRPKRRPASSERFDEDDIVEDDIVEARPRRKKNKRKETSPAANLMMGIGTAGFIATLIIVGFILVFRANPQRVDGGKFVNDDDDAEFTSRREKPRQRDVAVKPSVSTEVLSINGKLTEIDPIDPKRAGCRHHVYPLKMLAGKTYVIEMQGFEFRACIRLEDSKGAILGTTKANDEDPSENLAARFNFQPLRDDDYRIVATTYRGGYVGAYRLTVRMTQ